VQAQDVPVVVEITREFQKSVREEIAPHVFRTVHASSREKVSTLSGVTGVPQTVPVPGPGMYHITARARDDETVAPVSASTVVHGTETDAQGEFWQTDPRNFSLQSDQQTYRAGETAVLTASAPFSGKVWVSVECDSVVLDGFPADLVHNAGRLEVPIKEGYFPNVWVHVFLLKPGGPTGLPAECVGSLELKVQRPESELEVVAALASQEVEPGRMVSGTLAIRCNNAPVPDADVTLYAVDDALLVAGGWHAPSLNAALYTPRPWGVHSATSNLWRLAEGLKKGGQMQKGFIVGGGGEDETTGPRKSVRKNFLPLAHWQTGLRSDAGGKLAFAFPAPDSLTRYRIVALAQTRDSAFGVGQETVEVSKKIQIEPALPRFVRSGDELEIRVLVRQKLAERLSVTLRCSGSLVFTGGTSQTQEVRREEPGVFRFHAKADGGTSASLAFSTEAGSGDAVEMNFPIHPPTLLRRESVFAAVRSGSVESAVAEAIPERWSRATGHASVSMSTSAWLPSIAALPRILEYPHGCTEQISSRILGYTVLGDLIEYLADDGERDRNYRTRVSAGLERLSAILLPDGSLPYWPGGPASHFGTVIGFWAAHEAMAKDWSVPEKFHERLQQRVSEMALGKDSTVSGFMRCFAVAVLSLCGAEERTLEPVIRDLYAKRKDFSSEARAFLAVAMFQFGVLEPQREQLLQEIDRPPASADFDHYAFSSPCREEAVRAWAFATIHPDQKVGHSKLKTWERVLKLLESSESLSTQENFWLLMAFRALHSHMQEGTAGFGELHPRPDAISRNRRTVAWNPMPIANLRDFSAKLPVPAAATLHALWKAEYRMDTTADDVRMDRGLRLERVVVNRTDAARNGTPEAPFKLGDELEITFRLLSPKLHHYVALEADLPGCFEALNPQIASVGKSLPPVAEGAENPLLLSFSELRDKVACLYMDRVDRGLGVVSTRVRVTSAGTFIWPPTQVAPMYDTRFSGLSAGSTCHVVE
jgi:hypothetical protein